MKSPSQGRTAEWFTIDSGEGDSIPVFSPAPSSPFPIDSQRFRPLPLIVDRDFEWD